MDANMGVPFSQFYLQFFIIIDSYFDLLKKKVRKYFRPPKQFYRIISLEHFCGHKNYSPLGQISHYRKTIKKLNHVNNYTLKTFEY